MKLPEVPQRGSEGRARPLDFQWPGDSLCVNRSEWLWRVLASPPGVRTTLNLPSENPPALNPTVLHGTTRLGQMGPGRPLANTLMPDYPLRRRAEVPAVGNQTGESLPPLDGEASHRKCFCP